MTVIELAGRTGVNRCVLGRWLGGSRSLRIRDALAIAAELGLSIRVDPETLLMGRKRVGLIAPNLRGMAVPLTELQVDPANLRVHGAESIAGIKASLQRFGQQKPIVVDRRGVAIAGSGVLLAARELEWTHVAVVTSDLVGADRVGFAIADNRTPELSTWDRPALFATLSSISLEDAGKLGFTPEEIARLATEQREAAAPEVATPAIPRVPVSRTGDLWLLNDHRLLCGDSTSTAHVDRLMAGQRAALVSTDPPYLVDYTGVRANGRGKDWSEQYREIDVQDAGEFFHALFVQVVRVMAPNAAVYCWHAHKRLVEILQAWAKVGLLDHQQLVWVKPSPVPGSVFWHFRHEPCIMGWKQGSKPEHDGRHDETSVWVAPGAEVPIEQLPKGVLVEMVRAMSSAWEVNWEGKARPAGNEHPTQKPVELFAKPIRKHTRPGDVCFEPFSGSGTQIVAAEQLGRRCYALELEPVFVDVAVRRWQTLTGMPARLESTGRTWAEMAKARKVRIQEPPCPPTQREPAVATAARGSRLTAGAKSTGRQRRRRG